MLDSSKKVSEILIDVLRQNNVNKMMLEQQAISMWQLIMGPTVKRATRNVYLKKGIMVVELESSVVRQELSMLKDKIINKINESVGEQIVNDIIFR